MTQSAQVDLALVLAMDCSSSVDEVEVALQMNGLSEAFRRKGVIDAIQNGRLQRIAVSVVQWSGLNNQAMVFPWTIISSASDSESFAAAIALKGRLLEPTATSISSALMYAEDLLLKAPEASRQVIDVSAEGPNNIGPPLRSVRDRILQKGIVINGLAVSNEWRNLDLYLETEVAGGEGHFVLQVQNYTDYADGIYLKLVREITDQRLS